MSRLLAVCFVLLTSPAFAADDKDKPKPNTLTPKEIADGWILLFDGETTYGWKIDGAAEVKDGVMILGKDGKKTVAYPTTKFGLVGALSFEVSGAAQVNYSHGLFKTSTTVEGWGSYQITFDGNERGVKASAGTVFGGKSTPEAAAGAPFCIETIGDAAVKIRSVKLKPFGAKPLFTGKNLDGWKINAADPKRMASMWDVTKEGEISLKNGPGDLVTEKEFDNFVLQIECKTLGDSLNSGVFFRCIPGQYQNGYEAQIHNGFIDKDRTKPKDFGTGAIYRRIAARKIVANDREWFTMTVVADGKHMATWVNGYQTVDWTDDRKENENPRNGYRAAKGPISLQGHDKTTDILFRNIHIEELPGK